MLIISIKKLLILLAPSFCLLQVREMQMCVGIIKKFWNKKAFWISVLEVHSVLKITLLKGIFAHVL